MSYYKGPHSPTAWLAAAAFCAVLVLVEHSFLGLILGIALTASIGFVIFKLIGGDRGFFK